MLGAQDITSPRLCVTRIRANRGPSRGTRARGACRRHVKFQGGVPSLRWAGGFMLNGVARSLGVEFPQTRTRSGRNQTMLQAATVTRDTVDTAKKAYRLDV